jgi:SAM-dependent methyltransferase
VEQKDKLQWIYSSRDNEELSERYDQWAKDYDNDLENDFAWRGPEIAAGFFAKYVPKEARILDAGAGTGLVGVALAQRGYRDIVAIDLSKGMLEEAGRKNVYREFHQMVMGETLDFPTGAFDAAISVGVLTLGHAPASSFDELIRVTRPGGHIVFSLRPDVYEEGGFKEKMAELENEGKWELVEVSEKKQVLPRGEPDVYHQVWIYRVSG